MNETVMDLILDSSVEIILFQVRTWLGFLSPGVYPLCRKIGLRLSWRIAITNHIV